MKINIKKLSFTIISALLISSCNLQADDKIPTVHDMLEASGLKIDYKEIDSGNIVIFPRKDQESTDRSIALSMGVYLNASYDDVIQALVDGNNALSDYPGAMFVRIKDTKNIKPHFKEVGFSKRENAEVNRLYSFKDGDNYNLSSDEIKRWRSIVKKGQKSSAVAGSFFQDVLEQRTAAYLKGGLNKIKNYDQDGDDVKVAKGMKSSSVGLSSFKKWFPEFYKDYLNYPKILSNKYIENFYWYKDVMDDRPVFMLKHQMIKVKKNMAMVAERQYYISHGLDAIQMQMIVLPYKKGTFIGLSSQSFTQKVSGFGRGIAVKVGRNMMTKQIKPMLEKLHKKFN